MSVASALTSYNKKFKKNSGTTAIHTITLSSINNEEIPDQICLTNYQQVASYNWTDEKVPTILVPGRPPKWSPPALPTTLKNDKGRVFINQNGARCSNPMTPIFSALHIMYPAQSLRDVCDMRNVDLITDRSNLRKLSYFASGQVRQGFRIDVEIVENTMVFTRCEERNTFVCKGDKLAGYGHEFEKNFLEYEKSVEGSTGHHQIAAYEIGGMKWMVRFEVDGYLGNEGLGDEEQGNDLNVAIENLKIDTALVATTKILGINVISKGSVVPPDSILEVKTGKQTSRKKHEWMQQAYFSQTKNLIGACVGLNGVLTEHNINKLDLTHDLQSWERDGQNQRILRSVVGLIGRIRTVVDGMEGKKAVLWCHRQSKDVIDVHAYTGPVMRLQEDVVAKLWGTTNA
jgi:hypothetical protein